MLIETVFSNRETIDLAGRLQEGDAQTFIDVIHLQGALSFFHPRGMD